ncbi:uncharacterized protein EV420DRAFT_1071612 [Desarmillaria tabescens]|uniref:Uncharacterized protein n=1 Tax=Armillaria tabescens TaxID=1929756 RepID=A0AA39JJA2_ARMTA|nr:uncharacterized protein EV420DRAFT_1071612 [Desarmillaria tabescens]KAK0442796.1 hypothetical protein EV420DRAFT_1071612 [Desarmillaria tabescens]
MSKTQLRFYHLEDHLAHLQLVHRARSVYLSTPILQLFWTTVSVANVLLSFLPSSDRSACRSSICIVVQRLYSVYTAADASVRCLFAPCGFCYLASTLFPFRCRWTVTQQYLVYPRAACCALYPLISFGCFAKCSHVYPCAACCVMYCLVPPCRQCTAHGPPAGAEFIVDCAANSFHVYPRAACCVLYFSHVPFGCLSNACMYIPAQPVVLCILFISFGCPAK